MVTGIDGPHGGVGHVPTSPPPGGNYRRKERNIGLSLAGHHLFAVCVDEVERGQHSKRPQGYVVFGEPAI